MFGPVELSRGHELTRTLGQKCSPGCFLHLCVGERSSCFVSKQIDSIEVKMRFSHTNFHINLKRLETSQFSAKWAQIWCVSSFWHTLQGKPYPIAIEKKSQKTTHLNKHILPNLCVYIPQIDIWFVMPNFDMLLHALLALSRRNLNFVFQLKKRCFECSHQLFDYLKL